MNLVSLLIVLILFGAGLYLVGLIPMDGTIRRIIQVIAIVAIVIWLLRHFAPALSI